MLYVADNQLWLTYIIISNVAFQVVNKNVDGESENRQGE